MQAGRQEGIWKRWRCKQRAGRAQLWRLRAGHARGAHRKHVTHVCDAGRVEAQRLVERRRALPSRKGEVWEERAAWRAEEAGAHRGGGRGASSVQAGYQLRRVVGRGARAQRTLSMLLKLVTLDVSKLSGWLNADAVCRGDREGVGRGGGMRGRGEASRAWEGIAVAQAACREGAKAAGGSLARGGTRGAHPKHAPHVRDAGRVEAQRLVERIRVLPSARGGMLRGR